MGAWKTHIVMNKRRVGAEKERLAEDYLRKQNVRIMKRNFRVRQGEIDLIGYDNRTLVFFEVKYRRNKRCGYAQSAVDKRKQRQICLVAMYFCSFYNIDEAVCIRFDVIAIDPGGIAWIKNAFSYISMYE